MLIRFVPPHFAPELIAQLRCFFHFCSKKYEVLWIPFQYGQLEFAYEFHVGHCGSGVIAPESRTLRTFCEHIASMLSPTKVANATFWQ
jgi:hypothetical protein